eukprot:754902-Hanusia_phi.AAC.5
MGDAIMDMANGELKALNYEPQHLDQNNRAGLNHKPGIWLSSQRNAESSLFGDRMECQGSKSALSLICLRSNAAGVFFWGRAWLAVSHASRGNVSMVALYPLLQSAPTLTSAVQ